MELKYTTATIFLLFLILGLPHFSSCYHEKAKVQGEGSPKEEVYEIDYRGPETHPVLPFPSQGRPRFRPQHPRSKPPPQTEDTKENKVRG